MTESDYKKILAERLRVKERDIGVSVENGEKHYWLKCNPTARKWSESELYLVMRRRTWRVEQGRFEISTNDEGTYLLQTDYGPIPVSIKDLEDLANCCDDFRALIDHEEFMLALESLE